MAPLTARALSYAALLLAISCSTGDARARAGNDPRLVIALGVLPQIDQFIGDTRLPAEIYRGEILVPVGRRWRAGAELAGRRDFVMLGPSFQLELSRSSRREWRAIAGLVYAVPLGGTEQIFRRFKGEGSDTFDRLHLRLGIGQTFDLQRGRVALRVEYDARFMRAGSLLSVLENLDDAVNGGETFWLHELVAGVEILLGGGP